MGKTTAASGSRRDYFCIRLESITVQVLSGNTSGSGILIDRNNNLYSVITNHHVLIFGEPTLNYRIKTPDGSIYPAKVISPPSLKKYDLGLLQFSTKQTYATIQLNPAVVSAPGQKVYAAGFPAESNLSDSPKLLLTQGKIEMLSQQSFGGGYQIGSSNLIKKGMSGGPLLSSQGELIGINGLHKYPLWGNPFTFEDGSTAPPATKKHMSQFSWAIPISTLAHLVPQLASDLRGNHPPSTGKRSWFD